MKNSTAIAFFGLAIVAAAVGATTLPAAETTATPTATDSVAGQPAPRRAGPPSPEMEAYHQRVLEIYDADKNGRLDEDERQLHREDIKAGNFEAPPTRAPRGQGQGQGPGRGRGPHAGPPPEVIEKYDANKDGKLDESERAVLHADVEAGTFELPRPPRGERGGPGRPAILERYDANKDGQLDESERTALKADVDAGKFPALEHRRGQRAKKSESSTGS